MIRVELFDKADVVRGAGVRRALAAIQDGGQQFRLQLVQLSAAQADRPRP